MFRSLCLAAAIESVDLALHKPHGRFSVPGRIHTGPATDPRQRWEAYFNRRQLQAVDALPVPSHLVWHMQQGWRHAVTQIVLL